MKKLSLILILFLQFVANAHTLLSKFNMNSSDPNFWGINGGYSYGFDKTTTIISMDGQHQINIPRNPSSHYGEIPAYDGKYIANFCFDDVSKYTITVYNEKGIQLKQSKLNAGLIKGLSVDYLPFIRKFTNSKDKIIETYSKFTVKTIHLMDDKVFLEFSSLPVFSVETEHLGGNLLCADINDPIFIFKRFEIDFPKSEIARQPDFNSGWNFFKMQNHLLYFYRPLVSNMPLLGRTFSFSGKMFYEIICTDVNGKVKNRFNIPLTSDAEDEMKYDAGCYIPEFDTSHFYILRNFEPHPESEESGKKNISGKGKQHLGFELIKCKLNNGEIVWSKFVDYIDNKKYGFSGFCGYRIFMHGDYYPEFPIEVICRFNKIIVRKWAPGSSSSNDRMITMFDTLGNIVVNKVMTESKKEMKKNYMTEFQEEDIKDISYYDGWKKLKTESKLSIDNIPYFNPDNFYLVGYDEKLRKCYIYK